VEQTRELLDKVKSAKIPRHLKHQLTQLLNAALHILEELAGSGHGSHVALSRVATFGNPFASPLGLLSGEASARASSAHQKQREKACRDLNRFVSIIERDRRRHKPRIPGALATEWIHSARAIETTVGCSTGKSHGHSSGQQHPGGR
jgi:hypothetical protein